MHGLMWQAKAQAAKTRQQILRNGGLMRRKAPSVSTGLSLPPEAGIVAWQPDPLAPPYHCARRQLCDVILVGALRTEDQRGAGGRSCLP